MKKNPKGETVDTTNLQPGERIHVKLALYHVTSIIVFTSKLDFFCAKTRIICVFPTASKRAPVNIICSILTTLNNEKQPFKHVIVYKYGALENLIDVTNLLVD